MITAAMHIGRTTSSDTVASGWVLAPLTAIEMASIVGVLLAGIGLNVNALNEGAGLLLLGAFVASALASVPAAFVAMSASQAVVDPSNATYTVAQTLFVALAVRLFLFRHASTPSAFWLLLAWTLPYTLFTKLLALYKWETVVLVSDFDYAVLYGLVAAGYTVHLRGRYALALGCIGLGMGAAVFSYWLSAFGVQMVGSEVVKNQLVQTLTAGRGDGNYVGVCITCAFAIAAGCLLIRRLVFSATRPSSFHSGLIALFLLAACIPAAVNSQARGAIFSIAVLGMGSFIAVLRYRPELRFLTIVIIALTTFAFALNVMTSRETITILTDVLSFTLEQSADSVLMSRTATWTGALQEFLNSPLIGTTADTQVWIPSYGFDYASHNVWLDYGRESGVFGVLWFTAFFVYPLFRLYRTTSRETFLCWALPFAAIFLAFMNISLGNFKVFFILWALTSEATRPFGWRYRAQLV